MSEILDIDHLHLTKEQVREIEIMEKEEQLAKSWVRLMSYILTGDPDKLQ